MIKKLRTVKTYRRSWDSDNALKCTYKGLFGKYQIRAYIFLALGYGIVGAWLTEMPTFACKNCRLNYLFFKRNI